ncbi:hypothetical protein [Winogradskyella pacifica]|uniref:NIPSNAP protein n=1 Tax=Winogradskyella pacifica TaxID=664642 RepID=A0A3D9MZI6_9FLAO|nr:hypothetical protein [Winogradskyella pacifica]REE24767.1 hypothetical protein DFQ09_10373 [Winogradskyella pacifica]
MKTIKRILFAACFAFLLPAATQAQEDESNIMQLTEYTIKFGHNSTFVEGVKKWNKCYKENNGTNKWNVWHRLQGKGNIYVLESHLANWAEMAETDAAGKACTATALEFIIPNIESFEYNTTRSIPEFSKKTAFEDLGMVWVTNFKVSDYKAFNEAVKEMSSAISKKEGDNRGYWYRVMGGENADFFISEPFKDFADLDKDQESIWKLYEDANGKSKAEALRQKFKDAVDDQWSYAFTLETELSMN